MIVHVHVQCMYRVGDHPCCCILLINVILLNIDIRRSLLIDNDPTAVL